MLNLEMYSVTFKLNVLTSNAVVSVEDVMIRQSPAVLVTLHALHGPVMLRPFPTHMHPCRKNETKGFYMRCYHYPSLTQIVGRY